MEILTKIIEQITAFMGYSIAGITVGMICKALIVLLICKIMCLNQFLLLLVRMKKYDLPQLAEKN